jgi:hypothetical protein
MERKRVANVLQVDELRDFAVGIASDVDDHAVAIGAWSVDRRIGNTGRAPNDRAAIENGKVADVLIA